MKFDIREVKNWILYSKKYRNFIKHLEVVRLTRGDFEDGALKIQVFDTYRDIFGHSGSNDWGEYVKCVSCKKVYDIEKVHGLEQYVHISDLTKSLPPSHCCYAPLEYFHSETSLEKKFDSLLNKKDVFIYILKDKKYNKIVGLVIGYISLAKKAWEESIKDKLVLGEDVAPEESWADEDVLYVDEIGIIKSYRHGSVPFFRLFTCFLSAVERHRSVKRILFWTSVNSKLFRLTQQLPHEILVKDMESPARVVISLSFSGTYKKVKFINMVYN